jgi:hypothetical protein
MYNTLPGFDSPEEWRAAGATRAILFTPRPDAIAAYRALGFEPIGRYAIVLFSASP